MTLLSGFIRKQGQFVLGKKQNAFLHTVFLAVIPYTDWLSLAVIALITLRKGIREGLPLLLAGMIAYFICAGFFSSLTIGLTNTLLTFLPGFFAAITLRLTKSWRWVAIICLLQVSIAALCLQTFAPEYIEIQFQFIQHLLSEVQNDNFAFDILMNRGLNQTTLANYLVGVQAVGVILSGISALMLARSVQAELFYPGGFKKEMETFRGDKIGLLILLVCLFAAHGGNVLAMNILPMLMVYFMLAGLSLGSHILYNKKPVTSLFLLVTPLIFLPFVMLPLYVIFGSLDSIFNFRSYLAVNADNRA
ncbi:membrane protein (plasmid) [Legionella adelaidensis]|uniref:Membrane protein n=1 Tax=Legionella adelaidensis TaxID=45056 RepID=A0A0W0R1W6_9GAMM|nr:hypothetical protein [Legionella adelaidensis]KTC65087.1 membrane protein [Legionella adelaidensis]VEH85393.1 membrane protein [Legionella adelaidensis]